MTTPTDNKQSRDGSELWNISLEYTLGVPENTSIDPTGQYPRNDYMFGSSVNLGARGGQIHELDFGGSYQYVDTNVTPPNASVYPHNQVNETPAGHVISIDDTPGAERILIKHSSGSGIEMREDGSVVISSKNNRVTVVGGSQSVLVEGDADLSYKGNLTMNVQGDYRLNVLGDMITNVEGKRSTEITGADYTRVASSKQTTVRENYSEKVLGDYSSTVLGFRTDVVNGPFELYVDDKGTICAKELAVSAEQDISIAADKASMIAQDLAVIGDQGTIGGENMEHFGKVYSGPSNGQGNNVTFYGTLIGLATEATTSEYAKWAEHSWGTLAARYCMVASGTGSIPSNAARAIADGDNINSTPNFEYPFKDTFVQNEPSWRMPTSGVIQNLLDATDQGIVKVNVLDEDIKDRISFNDMYQDILPHKPSLREIRLAMRVPSFRNSEAPMILVNQGLLSSNYATAIPSNVTKASDSKASTRFGETRLGNSPESTNKSFKVRDEQDDTN